MAASAVTAYSKYVQQVRKKDPTVLLGDLVWYSVAEATRIKHADLCDALIAAGLPAFQPPAPKDEDVFQRVCTAHQRKKVETDDPNVYENYLMRKVKAGPDVFTKHIVVERVNTKGKKLGYDASVQIEFTVATGKIVIETIGRRANQQALNLAELIKRDYRAERGCVNAYTVRELIRRMVNSTGATLVKPTGGIYFIMASEQATVDAILNFADTYEGVTFHSVPLINDREQQSMLRTAFEAETKGTVEERLDQIDEMLAGPEITARRYSDLIAEMHEIQGKTGKYRDLLDDTLAATDLILGSYEAKMKKLFLHVKGD